MKSQSLLTVVGGICCLLTLTFVGITDSASFEPQTDVTYLNSEGGLVSGIRCATVDSGPVRLGIGPADLRRWAQQNFGTQAAMLNVPVAFHVIYKSDGTGNLTDAEIAAQIDVLNAAYATSGFSFTLASVDRTQSNTLFRIRPNSVKERLVKRQLAVDPAEMFNVYTCQPSAGILGWATFPWMYPEDDFMHGVVMLYSSLPGGSAAPYNEGDTLTHEAGHYLGLYHTFQGGCSAPGDLVDDTPYEAEPAYGCPVDRNTCPAEGLDPIHNFMDYVDDFCMYEFTPLQADRMVWATTTYRPSLVDVALRAPAMPSGVAAQAKLATLWAAIKQ